MTPAERQAITEAAERIAAEAPPLPPEALEMLRHDRCPIVTRRNERNVA